MLYTAFLLLLFLAAVWYMNQLAAGQYRPLPFMASEQLQSLTALQGSGQAVGGGIVAVFAAVLALLLVCVRWLRRFTLPRLLAVLLGIFGLAYFLLVPVLQVPDETGHFYRSYEISMGDFLSRQGEDHSGISLLPKRLIPVELQDLEQINYARERAALTQKVDQNDLMFYSNPTQALYAPVNYFPQALGIFLCRLVTDSSIAAFYVGRLFNFLCCGLLVFLAVRLIPTAKRFLLLAALMPVCLQQMISLSSDAAVNALAFLLLAEVLAAMERREALTAAQKLALIATCMAIALCKIVYLPLCFLIFLIPDAKWAKGRRGLLWKIAVAGVSTLLNLGWLAIGLRYMIAFRAGVDSRAQLQYMLTDLPGYLLVLLRTLADKWLDWLGTMVGAKLCRMNVYTDLLMIVLFLLLLGFELLTCTREEQNAGTLDRKGRIFCFFLAFVIFGMTLSSLYVQWTPLRSPVVEGFQGRYLIPLLPLTAVALKRIPLKMSGEELLAFELPVVMAANVCALFSIFVMYH